MKYFKLSLVRKRFSNGVKIIGLVCLLMMWSDLFYPIAYARIIRCGEDLFQRKKDALERLSGNIDPGRVDAQTTLYELIRLTGECEGLSPAGETLSYEEIAERMKQGIQIIDPRLDTVIDTPWGEFRLTDLNNILSIDNFDAVMKISFLLEIAQVIGEINIEGFQFKKAVNTRRVQAHLKDFLKEHGIEVRNIQLSLSDWTVWRSYLENEVLAYPEIYKYDYNQYEFIKGLVEEGRVKNTKLAWYFTAMSESERGELGWHWIDLTIEKIEENLDVITEESVRGTVATLIEGDIEPTRAKVAEELGVSVDVLAGVVWINNIDLIYLGVKGRAKLTEQGVRNAVAELGGRATRANVAAWLGVYYDALIRWATRNNYNLETDFGIVSLFITEETIITTVQKLKETGILPTRTAICNEMGINRHTLTNWASRNEINLATLGVVKKVITIEKIQRVVRNLTSKEIQPTKDNVADVLHVSSDSLVKWASKNDIDLRELGVIMQFSRSITLERIERAKEILTKDGIAWTMRNIARILGCAPESLSNWAWRTGNSLKDLGLVETRITEENILQAVALVKSGGMVPTRARVANKLDVVYKSLTAWFSRTGRDPATFGIVDVKQEVEYLLDHISELTERWDISKRDKIALSTILDESPREEVESFLRLTNVVGFKILILSENSLSSLLNAAESSEVSWSDISNNYLLIREKSKIAVDILALMEFEIPEHHRGFPQKEDLETLNNGIQKGFQEISDMIISLITKPTVSKTIENSQNQLLELLGEIITFKNREFTSPGSLRFPTRYSDLGITTFSFNYDTSHIELKSPTNNDHEFFFYFGINHTRGVFGCHRQYIKLDINDNGLELKVYTWAIHQLLVFVNPSLKELSAQIFPPEHAWSDSGNFSTFLNLFEGYILELYSRTTEQAPEEHEEP